MAVLISMRRRRSGIYAFRKRLPRDLAGRRVPAALRVRFPELADPATRCFKTELTISLGTSDPWSAKRKDLRAAARRRPQRNVFGASPTGPQARRCE